MRNSGLLPWLFLSLLTASAFAGVPQTINYQGLLTTSLGAPATGPVSMVFSLYSSNPARSNPVWRETQSTISLSNGIYSTKLGSVTPITAPFDVPYYLGVKVGSDPEMGLQALSSVPYAQRAATLDSGTQTIFTGAAGNTGLIVKGVAGQTANLQEWFQKSGTSAASITPGGSLLISGNFTLPNTSATTGAIRQNGKNLIHTYGTNNFFAGSDSGNLTTTGTENTAMGAGAMIANTTGSYNTATGYHALAANQTGTRNAAYGFGSLINNTIGTDNAAFGFSSLYYNTQGGSNTAIGWQALAYNSSGSNNTALGNNAGLSLQTGSNNIYIGSNVDAASIDESNTVRIGSGQTKTYVAGTLSAGGLGNIAAPCLDGEFLRFDSRTTTWKCNPINGGFTVSGPPVGYLTLNGVSTALDIRVYGFDLQLIGGSVTQQQKTYSLDKIKVRLDPGRYGPALAMRIAGGFKHQTAGLWLLDPATQQYVQFVTLDGVVLTGQSVVPPSRDMDATLFEYTLIPEKITFTSPLNSAQITVANLVSGLISTSGCSLTTTPVFTSIHGLPVNMATMFPGNYPISSYSAVISSAVTPSYGGTGGLPTFTPVTVTGSTLTDGPCFMNALTNQIFSEVKIVTASSASVSAGSTILESAIRIQPGHVTGYRLFSASSGTLQHEITISPSTRIYWGYYPFNAATQLNDPVVETGWNLILNSAL